MRECVIVGGARTPFGKFGGGLKSLKTAELGGIAIREAIARSGADPSSIEEVLMGMVLQGGAGQNPSRQAARLAGLDWSVPAETINKVCASGHRSVTLADQIIRSGDADILVAGGMESMSNAPYIIPDTRWGSRMGHAQSLDLMLHDGLECAFSNVHMISHGNRTAAAFGITRTEQDEWALRSHQRSVHAIKKGFFDDEIVPVLVKSKADDILIRHDEAPRADTSLDQLTRLSPALEKEGTITAGNAPGVNDGAAALVLMSREDALSRGLKPLATIVGHAAVSEEAPYIATAPGLAIQKLLQRTSVPLSQIDRFEVNEAFASVPLTTGKMLGWDEEKVNVNGGAIALGHPIGASGARIVLTLVHELRRIGGGYGIAAICSGGGQGDALLLRVDV
ncbi:acetyl-CoA C-acetyltransferase [Cohnella pontilimi]|uniref:acetyl-CoA C-acetyltransferase n=1 Tax=Cohnella pontilimi TaxID=2564100 RepID=A0A4V5LSQ5_9BACL|nr:acetyl-CoA C-acetyltransferase [Cohnella pontilimi]TJY44019.1 acetyl-CoA C-acetyltransferase [Cohnella pontilimi]